MEALGVVVEERELAVLDHRALDLLDDRPAQTTPDPSDPNAGKPLNILVMGSDARGGENGHDVEGVEGMRSDTAMIVHLSEDRKGVT